MKYYQHCVIFLLVLFFDTSCGTKKEETKGILNHPEMVNSLLDIYVAEQKISVLNLPRDSAEKIFNKLRVRVLDSLQVQDSVLKKSYDYYLDHPKELEEIYTALVDSLNLREQRVISKPAGL